MPADPHRSLLRHTGTNHVRHGGSPEIVEQKARLSNGLDRLPPSAPEVTHRLSFTVKHSITDTRAIRRSLSTRMRQWVHEISVGAPPRSLGSWAG